MVNRLTLKDDLNDREAPELRAIENNS